MKTRNNLLALFFVCASCLGGCIGCNDKIADLVIYGNIYTSNETDDVVEAIGIKKGKITYVGNKDGIKKHIGKSTKEETYSNDKLITAGLVDAHNHVDQLFVGQADELGQIPSGADKATCVSTIEKYVQDHPNKDFYKLNGWEMQNFASEEYGCPTASMIDYITTKPIYVSSSDGHTYWVNTPLMNLAGVNKDTVSPVGGEVVKDRDGNPLGIFKDTAQGFINLVKPDYSKDAYDEGINKADTTWRNQGYTASFNALGNDKTIATKYGLTTALEEKDKNNELSTYVQSSFCIFDVDNALDLVDIAVQLKKDTKGGNHELTHVKVFLDGIIENAGAYLSEPYLSDGVGKDNYYGAPIWEGNESIARLGKIIAKANSFDMPVHFHCMGDQAVCDALTAIELAANEIGKDKVRESRNTIVHLALVKESDYARFADLNVVACLNPWMNKDPGYFELLQVPYLGRTRAEKQYPAKSFLNNNIHVSFGTDMGASFTYNSIECFHSLTTRTYSDDDPTSLLCAEEKLSRTEALKAMTIGGAYQLFKEDQFGSLEVGKDATLVLFTKDLLTIPDSSIMSTEVESTMIKGVWYD